MAEEIQHGSAEDSTDRLEGMLIAHRKILARLIAAQQASSGADLMARLEDGTVMRDGQEDPGAVPTDGVATGLAIAEETSRILSLARVEMQKEPE